MFTDYCSWEETDDSPFTRQNCFKVISSKNEYLFTIRAHSECGVWRVTCGVVFTLETVAFKSDKISMTSIGMCKINVEYRNTEAERKPTISQNIDQT